MPKEGQHSKPHGGHSKQPADRHGSSPVELAAINETLIAFAKKYNEDKEKHPRREAIRFWLEICAAVGIAIYTVLTGGLLIASWYQIGDSDAQIKTSQDQLATMRDTEVRQLRAYVHLVPGTMITASNKPDETIDFSITPHVKVFGQTPAGGITVPEAIDVQEWPMTDNFQFHYLPQPGGGFRTTSSSPPGDDREIDMLSRTITKDEIANINLDRSRLYVYGTALYVDIFRIARFTNFCWRFTIPDVLARHPVDCPIHNGTDWNSSAEPIQALVRVPMK